MTAVCCGIIAAVIGWQTDLEIVGSQTIPAAVAWLHLVWAGTSAARSRPMGMSNHPHRSPVGKV